MTWKTSLFDKFNPDSTDMDEGSKRAVLNQGLLALASGLLGTPGGFGAGMGAGLQNSLLAMNKATDSKADNAYKRKMLEMNMSGGTEFRSLDASARAAGHLPGSEGYKDFFKRHNGAIGRASGAAIKYEKQVGADGVTRYIALDPNAVGAEAVGTGETYGAPVGIRQPSPQPMPQQAAPAPSGGVPSMLDSSYHNALPSDPQAIQGTYASLADKWGSVITSAQRPVIAAGAGARSQHPKGTAADFRTNGLSPDKVQGLMQDLRSQGYEVIDERDNRNGLGPHIHAELPPNRRPMAAPQQVAQASNPFASRPEEVQKAMSAEAEAAAKLRVEQSGYGAAAQQAANLETAKANAQAQAGAANAPTVANTQATIDAAGVQAKSAGEQYSNLQNKGMVARSENVKLQGLRSALKSTYTGTGAAQVLGMKKAASSLGIKVDGLGDAQVAQSLSNQLALSLRNPAGGEGMPGAMSDADRQFLVSSVPSLANTPDGWKAMIDMKVALNDAAIKQAKEAARLRREGMPVQDIPEALQELADANPVFKVKQSGQRRLKYNPATGRIE